MEVRLKYNIDWLLSNMPTDVNNEFLFFWRHNTRSEKVTKACLSQWWPSRFSVDGVTYHSAEHWMMVGKAKLFGADDVVRKILETDDPGNAKSLGREVKEFDAVIWDESKTGLVIEGNLHKFRQNPSLLRFLRNTRDMILVEASPVDTIWGAGLAVGHADIYTPSKWRGQNLLGFSLMTVRDLLRTENHEPFPSA